MKHSRDGLIFFTTPIVGFIDLPKDIQEEIKTYYAGTDHKEISNDSYIRYPYLFDLNINHKLDKWFIENIGDCLTEFIIIHFNW